MENNGNQQAARAFAGVFAESLAESLTSASAQKWQLKALDSPDLSNRQGQTVHFRLTVDGALCGEFFVEFHEPQVTELAAKICGQPATAFGDEHTEALAKVISTAMKSLTTSLSEQYGALTFKVDRVSGLAFGGMLVIPLSASQGEQKGMPVSLYFDGELLANLAVKPGSKDAAGTDKPAIDLLNLKLVMDVELNVSLRFGQRQLPLREVLELASGSVIELDRQVDDPVELLLDGKVIARGEAVIVDGNYGLRVTEIPQPMASHFIR